MLPTFHSRAQEQLFRDVLRELGHLGYDGDLLKEGYEFPDYFSPHAPRRVAPAAAFGQTPLAYDSACVAVLLPNGKSGPALLSDYRSLGAPKAFEVHDDAVVQWTVGTDPSEKDKRHVIRPGEVKSFFQTYADRFRRGSILRLKNISAAPPQQRDMIDLGLIPALERHVRAKLDPLLRVVLDEAKKQYERKHRAAPDDTQLVRLVFRSLTGKVMHDRELPGFGSLPSPPDPVDLLDRVARHYDDSLPVLADPEIQRLVVERLWGSVDFRNLSVEVLAFIWETTLVTDEVRRQLGIHATPPSVARYIVHRLPIRPIPEEDRRVVEPCCGSGTFLIAALQRLRELLPPTMDPKQRHRYFARMLRGFDTEDFGLEVARSCLMLADFPNPNGWKLKREDVFASPEQAPTFYTALRKARIVLCNPPFENFTPEQRKFYGNPLVQKPAELLTRVLQNTAPECLLGFVLPSQVLDGPGYETARKLIAERYGAIEVVSLPGKVFEHADHETALLIAKRPQEKFPRVKILHRKVADSGKADFLTKHVPSHEDAATKTVPAATRSLAVVLLRRVWERLRDYQKLGEVASISRGVEWPQPFDEERYISEVPKPGFRRGLWHIRGRNASPFFMFEPPARVVYLSFRPEDRRRNAFDLPWDEPKVIMNAVRRSRKAWRITAFADETGLVASQDFHGLWPTADWSPKAISAVLNSYVAAAFVGAHCPRKHIPKKVLCLLPLPRLDRTKLGQLDRLVDDYLEAVGGLEMLGNSTDRARATLQEIDALILKGYALPPPLEVELLRYFQNQGGRRPVPYLPEDELRSLQRAKNRSAVELLKGWMEDTSGYDEATWPAVKKILTEHRPSQRKPFDD